jgi:exonuclease I
MTGQIEQIAGDHNEIKTLRQTRQTDELLVVEMEIRGDEDAHMRRLLFRFRGRAAAKSRIGERESPAHAPQERERFSRSAMSVGTAIWSTL